MNPPETTPLEVTAAVERYARQHALEAARLLAALRWDALLGCYFFVRSGQYVGVETNGYVHT